jgi:hypothetical protein
MSPQESAIRFPLLGALRIDQKGVTMKGNLRMLTIVAIIAALFFTPTFAGADVFMKEKLHTDGMTIMGHTQPPQDKISTTWIAQDKMRTDQGDMSTIAKLEDGKMLVYHINHPKKTYTQLSMGSGALKDFASGMGGEMKVKITPTGESKKIGNWNCQKYLQEMDMGMMVVSEIWASEDIKIPYKDFYEKSAMAMMPPQPGMEASMQVMQDEMKKLKGVPVLTTTSTTMMQNTTIKSSRELIEIKEDTAPAGSYDIPAGYTKQEMPQGMGERRMPGKQKPKQ